MTNPSKTILVAEDDRDDRDIFEMALAEVPCASDYVLQFAKDGQELLQLLETGEALPRAVFLDLNMPLFNGKECLRELRRQATAEELPVIILSTSTSAVDINETYQLGANLYVEKPNSFASVVKMLERCICSADASGAPPLRDAYFVAKW